MPEQPEVAVIEWNEQQQMIQKMVRDFVEKEVVPHLDDIEYNGVPPYDILRKMIRTFGMDVLATQQFNKQIAREKAGEVTDKKAPNPEAAAEQAAMRMIPIIELCRHAQGLVTAMGVSMGLAGGAIMSKGSLAQKERWALPLLTLEKVGAWAISEPNAGSDAFGQMKTLARRDGQGGYIINGSKTWITNSVKGNVLAVLTKTDPNATPAHKGMSLFIVEKGPGFRVVRKLEKLGYRGIDTGEIVFEDCRVPPENLVGGIEGRGLQQILGGLELGRINVAARGVGIAQGTLDQAVKYAQVRKTFGKPIAEHQAIQILLADMATRAEASRLLVKSAAEAYDAGRRCDMEAGMAKLFASESALKNSLDAMRIHGAYGYSKEYDVERFYRDAPLLAIGEGTNELQHIIIARQLVQRNPA